MVPACPRCRLTMDPARTASSVRAADGGGARVLVVRRVDVVGDAARVAAGTGGRPDRGCRGGRARGPEQVRGGPVDRGDGLRALLRSRPWPAADDSRGSVWCDQVWLPRSWPAATMARPSSGWSESHVPTAKTVTWAPWSRRIWSARCVSAGSPAPWKVRATAGTDELPCRTSSPGVRSTAGTDCACAAEVVAADVPGAEADDGAEAVGLPAVAVEEGAGPATGGSFVEQAARPRPTAEARPPPIRARRPTTGGSSDTGASWPNALKVGWDHAVRPPRPGVTGSPSRCSTRC